MSLAQLPPLDFDTGGLRISLFPRSDSPLFTTEFLSGEPAVAEKNTSNGVDPPIPERRRSQVQFPVQEHEETRQNEGERASSLEHIDRRPPSPQPNYSHGRRPHYTDDDPFQEEAEADNPFHDQASDHTDSYSEPEQPKPQSKASQAIPTHPIPSMQDAFAESLHEVTMGGAALKPKLRALGAKERREKLLEQDRDEEPFDQSWRYRPGQKQHEVLKLLAQISFGVYLLLNGMANSNSQVVTILQGHIDEVDEFLEVALEDLQQATIDLNGRIDYLKLPMSNMQVFEELLEDRNFRVEILEGNEKIEHILSRTNMALKQWDDDVEAGLACSAAFIKWLNEQDSASWKTERTEVMDIFDAMNGNAEGWQNAFEEMNVRAQGMNNLIIKLMTIVAEMEKKAGEVSRKTWAQIPPFTVPSKVGGSTSPPISYRSDPRSQSSIRSGGSFPKLPTQRAERAEPQIDADSLLEYPLPGAAPLLPPPRISARVASRPPSSSSSARRQNGVTFADAKSPPRSIDRAEVASQDSKSVGEEEPLYILQPRVYTPQPPEPAPLQQSPGSRQSSRIESHAPKAETLQKQTSLRQRVSQKGNKPPVSIQIPPRHFAENNTTVHRNSPTPVTPPTGTPISHNPTYDSESEHPPPNHSQIPRMASYSDLSAPVRPPLMPSPRSDHQYYRPVQASPHSPLQQRPHTSGTGAAHRHQSVSYSRQHVRNQPSRLGGMSTLSNVTNAQESDARTIATQRTARGTERTLKKKKSAFGWLKKAFSMDEEERAAYEARKAMQVEPQYYDERSPKFLDGKRIR